MKVRRCPGSIDDATVDAVQWALLACEGHWPVAGGLLAQSASFLDLWHRVRPERERWLVEFRTRHEEEQARKFKQTHGRR